MSRSKSKLATALSTRESRLPITVALDVALLTNLVSVTRLALWKEELRDIIKEASKKFVGFQNIESIRKALDIVLGMMSLALMAETKGKVDPEDWAKYISRHNFDHLILQTISLVEGIHHTSPGKSYTYIFTTDQPHHSLRDLLLLFATSRVNDRWNGYEIYLDHAGKAAETQATDRLLRWFMTHLLEEKHAVTEQHSLLADAVTALEVIHTILLRYVAGIGFTSLSKKKEITLHQGQFIRIRKRYEANPETWLKTAAQRYTDLFTQIPKNLQAGLPKKNWFESYLKKGPPKITEKTKMSANIPSITGIYLYHMID